jgi:hypothetical protein
MKNEGDEVEGRGAEELEKERKKHEKGRKAGEENKYMMEKEAKTKRLYFQALSCSSVQETRPTTTVYLILITCACKN